MEVIHAHYRKDGKVDVKIKFAPGETVNDLVCVRPAGFFRLGYPLDDMVVGGEHIHDAVPVQWCSIEQKWVEA